LNANFDAVDTDIKAVQADVNAKNTARISDIDAQKARVDALIVGTPQPSEVVDARGGFAVLRDRLNGVDTSLADKAKQLDGVSNVKQYNVVGDGIVGDSDSIQAMINSCRADSISKTLVKQYTIEIPSGKYIIDKQIIMSPYIKLKSLGYVNFVLTFNGTAFWITPSATDFKPSSSDSLGLQKNAWNRGKYFDGSNGGFVFTTTLDKATTGGNTTAIELGDRVANSDTKTPIARYVIEQVNVFGLNTAIKNNAVNNYIGTFKHCHFELNNHAFWVTSPTVGTTINSGENLLFENCIISGHVKEAILLEVGGHDLTFENCSFDFNSSPVFRSLYSGASLRLNDCYLEMIGDGTGDEYIYSSEATSSGDANGRNSFYAKNFIVYVKRPSLMFRNLPNGSNGYINLYLDIDGMELRFQNTTRLQPYNISDRYLVNSPSVILKSKKIINTSVVKSVVSPDINLINNSSFARTAVSTDLSVSGSDPYWFVSFKSNITNPTVVAEGVSGSNALKWTVNTAGANSMKLESKFQYRVEAGERILFSTLVKTDKVSSGDTINYRLECYDQNGTLINTLNYYDYLGSGAVTVMDGTQFQLPRDVGTFYIPAETVNIKPILILSNLNGTFATIDDIHLSKAK
jgi:hypothetical protein